MQLDPRSGLRRNFPGVIAKPGARCGPGWKMKCAGYAALPRGSVADWSDGDEIDEMFTLRAMAGIPRRERGRATEDGDRLNRLRAINDRLTKRSSAGKPTSRPSSDANDSFNEPEYSNAPINMEQIAPGGWSNKPVVRRTAIKFRRD